MTFDAKVIINGKEYDAMECGFGFKRNVDEKGAPSSHITNIRLFAIIKAGEGTELLESAFSEYKPLKGRFVYLKGDEQSKLKELEFERAFIVEYDESFVRQGDTPMCIKCVFTAEKVSCGSAYTRLTGKHSIRDYYY